MAERRGEWWLCVSGSRDMTDYQLLESGIDAVCAERGRLPSRVLHGGAPGADALASRWAYEHGVDLEIHGALWGQLGKRAGPLRNQTLADRLGADDVLLAFPSQRSRGTTDMVARAAKREVHVVVRWID